MQLDEDAKRLPFRDFARNGRIRWDFGEPAAFIEICPSRLDTAGRVDVFNCVSSRSLKGSLAPGNQS